MDESTIRHVHELSTAVDLAADIRLHNESLSESAIIAAFRSFLDGVDR